MGFDRVSFPRGGKMRLHGLLGRQVCIVRKACGKLGGSRGMPPPPENFGFGPFIRCNLVGSGTVFAPT